MIFPRPCLIMTLPTACAQRKVPVRLVSSTLVQSSRGICSVGAPQETPALLDQDIDPPKPRERRVHNLLNTGGGFDIASQRQSLPSELLQFLGSFLAAPPLARPKHDGRPHFRPAFRH